jgi:hypothetical protein
MRLWVSMGVKRGGRPREPLRPRLIELDADSGEVLRQLDWTTPPCSGAGPEVHQEFTAGHLVGEHFWQPTHTELLRIDPVRMEVTGAVAHPLLHGVHSVAPGPDDTLVVSCAGLDSVLELSTRGELVHHHFLGSGHFTDRHPEPRDFRRVPYDALKPHSHHPNHAVWVDGQLFATCFETRRAHRLVGSGPDLLLPEGIPHDGRLRDGLLWFTQVDGRVVAMHPDGHRVHTIELADLDPRPGLLGWCRGVEKVGHHLFVGFTQLRRSRHREVARWLLEGQAGIKRDSRVVVIDLRGPRIIAEHPVGNEAGGTIYGIWAMP